MSPIYSDGKDYQPPCVRRDGVDRAWKYAGNGLIFAGVTVASVVVVFAVFRRLEWWR